LHTFDDVKSSFEETEGTSPLGYLLQEPGNITDQRCEPIRKRLEQEVCESGDPDDREDKREPDRPTAGEPTPL
jgi:hypothetical protein